MRQRLLLILFITQTVFALPARVSEAAQRARSATTDPLPAAYFRLLEAGAGKVEQRMDSIPGADLKALEAQSEWRHFPYAILAPAVLYAKRHPRNTRFRDPKMLALAIRIGDLLASENEKGVFEPRLDSDWDTYMWLETYRPGARLVWPVFPFNPYSNSPETDINTAVGALSAPLRLKSQPGRYIRTNEQELVFALEVE